MKNFKVLRQITATFFLSDYTKTNWLKIILSAAAASTLSVAACAYADRAACDEATFTQIHKGKAQVLESRTGLTAHAEFDFTNNSLYISSTGDVFKYKNVDIDLYKRIYQNSILMFNNDRSTMTRVYLGANSSQITTYNCKQKRFSS